MFIKYQNQISRFPSELIAQGRQESWRRRLWRRNWRGVGKRIARIALEFRAELPVFLEIDEGGPLDSETSPILVHPSGGSSYGEPSADLNLLVAVVVISGRGLHDAFEASFDERLRKVEVGGGSSKHTVDCHCSESWPRCSQTKMYKQGRKLTETMVPTWPQNWTRAQNGPQKKRDL